MPSVLSLEVALVFASWVVEAFSLFPLHLSVYSLWCLLFVMEAFGCLGTVGCPRTCQRELPESRWVRARCGPWQAGFSAGWPLEGFLCAVSPEKDSQPSCPGHRPGCEGESGPGSPILCVDFLYPSFWPCPSLPLSSLLSVPQSPAGQGADQSSAENDGEGVGGSHCFLNRPPASFPGF